MTVADTIIDMTLDIMTVTDTIIDMTLDIMTVTDTIIDLTSDIMTVTDTIIEMTDTIIEVKDSIIEKSHFVRFVEKPSLLYKVTHFKHLLIKSSFQSVLISLFSYWITHVSIACSK